MTKLISIWDSWAEASTVGLFMRLKPNTVLYPPASNSLTRSQLLEVPYRSKSAKSWWRTVLDNNLCTRDCFIYFYSSCLTLWKYNTVQYLWNTSFVVNTSSPTLKWILNAPFPESQKRPTGNDEKVSPYCSFNCVLFL